MDSHQTIQGYFSSIGADIVASPTYVDRAAHFADRIQALNKSTVYIPLFLIVGSHRFYPTTTRLHEGADNCLRRTVSRLRDYFETGEIETIHWVNVKSNLADDLTKCNNMIVFTGLIGDETSQTVEG